MKMTQPRRWPSLSRVLVLWLLAVLYRGDALAQDMLGETGMSGLPNVSMPSGLSGMNTRMDGTGATLPVIRQLNSSEAGEGRSTASVTPPSPESVKPLPPNEFQLFVQESTGQLLNLYGASFFQRGSKWGAETSSSPVSPDYTLGPGDELQIRGWGALDLDVHASVDRDGFIHIPRIGAVNMAGVRSSQAEGLIRKAVGKYYRDFQMSVTVGRLKGITIYVVGQARKPGAYTVSTPSTLLSALFMSGGPNQNGSMRHIQVKRGGKSITELDLYAFVSKGDSSADVRLQEGDTIVIPPARGYVALNGKVATPGIYELADEGETVASLLALAGGLPIVADPKRVELERVDPLRVPPRQVEAFPLDKAGLAKALKSGDLLNVFSLVPEFGNVVTLRGNVVQPVRSPWRPGMRVADLIPGRSYLMSRASIRKLNSVYPSGDKKLPQRLDKPTSDMDLDESKLNPVDLRRVLPSSQTRSRDEQTDEEIDNRTSQGPTEAFTGNLAERIGNLVEEVNFEYAVIERVDTRKVSVQLLPFNLGKALDQKEGPDNLELQPGDIVTVFSVKDVRVPQGKRQIYVRIEGEVRQPGIYQMTAGEDLRDLIERAGGLTPDAYLFGAAFYREEVKKTQMGNLQQLLGRLEMQMTSRLSASASSAARVENADGAKIRMQAEADAQRQALERLRNLKPTGRIMLGLDVEQASPDQLPTLRLEPSDRLVVPARPDFVHVLGSVNTESALIWEAGKSVQYYLDRSGLTSGADADELFVIRMDGSVLSNRGLGWFGNVRREDVMPGDVIVLPEKTDHESAWSVVMRNAKDITQIVYQFSLGAAAIKTLRE